MFTNTKNKTLTMSKKLIFIISITLLAFNSQAQGTLQFNQVTTITHDTSFTVGTFSTILNETWDIYTVPASRVVKISKAINAIITNDYGCNINNLYFTINGIKTEVTYLEDSWIKAGDVLGAEAHLFTQTGSSSYHCDQYDNIFISLIEYNIIPE